MHSFMLLRHGVVVAEGWWKPYDSETPHLFFSLSKSFTSTAVGIAVAEGKLSLDDQVLKAFPDEAPAEPSASSVSRMNRPMCSSPTRVISPDFSPSRAVPQAMLVGEPPMYLWKEAMSSSRPPTWAP